MKIGFIGLGKLGLPCALAIESKGHEVIGYDLNPRIKNYLQNREVPYKEEGLQSCLDNTKIKLTSGSESLVGNCDIIFVAVQTPHKEEYEGIKRLPDDREDFDYSYIEAAMLTLANEAQCQKTDQVVAVISTVLPGTMDKRIKPIIKDKGSFIKLVYNPFFIAMGTTIHDFLYPEFVLIGVDDEYASKKLAQFYEDTITPSYYNPFFCSVNTAEAIKVLYNTYITQKIVFANAAMELCYYTGADVDHVIDALSMGNRRIISPTYMRGGMGDGGGCHPRDNIALSAISRKYEISYDWWGNLMMAREKQTEFLKDLIMNTHRMTGFPIVILGKAFKPETNLTIGSPSILLYNILKEELHSDCVEIYDPHVDGNIEGEGEMAIMQLEEPSICFIGTKHEIFASTLFPAKSVVIDPWRYIPDQEGINVMRIGEGK